MHFTKIIRFFFALCLASNLFGASIEFAKEMGYETNYNEALQKAKTTSKPIILIVSSETCPWCRKLENQTLSKEYIDKIIQDNFIPIAQTKEIDNLPPKFYPKYVPTVYFINPITNEAYENSVGYKAHGKFKDTLLNAITQFKELK